MVNRSRINIDKISIVSDIVDSIGVPDNLKIDYGQEKG